MKSPPSFVEIQFRPKSGVKNFQIQFPHKTLTAFRKLDPDIKADIVESLLPFYKVQRREIDEVRFAPLFGFFEARKEYAPPDDLSSGNLLEKWGKYEETTHNREVKTKVLRLLRYARFQQLSGEVAPILRLAVSQAIDDNDHRFFKQLGRLLEKQPVIFDPLKEPTPAEQLLIEHWICQKEKAVHLCCFTDAAIDDLLRAVGEQPTFDSVRKTRQRLGLQRLPEKFPFIRRVKREGDTVILG